MMMSNENTSVPEAKKILREARLREHVKGITNALAKGDKDALARACSGFVALYRNSGKKVKK